MKNSDKTELKQALEADTKVMYHDVIDVNLTLGNFEKILSVVVARIAFDYGL